MTHPPIFGFLGPKFGCFYQRREMSGTFRFCWKHGTDDPPCNSRSCSSLQEFNIPSLNLFVNMNDIKTSMDQMIAEVEALCLFHR
jgi:hypothetical protein